MKKTLLIMGHPHPENSISNVLIADEMKKVDGVSVRVLTEQLKNGEFDIAAEQKAVMDADVIVLQFPFYWFSVPSILQKWFEDVLLYGFAYGTDGSKLSGKKLLVSMTTGGELSKYVTDEANYFDTLLSPIRMLAVFTSLEQTEDIISCGMKFIPGMMGDKADVERRAFEHAKTLKERLANM